MTSARPRPAGPQPLRALAWIAIASLLSLVAGAASAQGLSQSDAAMIDTLLGPGVLGAPEPSQALTDASALLPLRTTTWDFRFVSGPRRGEVATDVLQPGLPGGPPVWLYSADDVTIYTLQRTADGTILSPSEQDLGQGVITRYDPPRPFLLNGAQPGVPEVRDLEVKVYDRNGGKAPAHSGTLTLTYTYVGRFQVAVPAGRYSAALVKLDYAGQIGPARVRDTEFWFFADNVGPVAVLDKQKVSALLVYSEKTKAARVLASPPQ